MPDSRLHLEDEQVKFFGISVRVFKFTAFRRYFTEGARGPIY